MRTALNGSPADPSIAADLSRTAHVRPVCVGTSGAPVGDTVPGRLRGRLERWFSYTLHQRGRGSSEASAGRDQTVFRGRRHVRPAVRRTGPMGHRKRHAGRAGREKPRHPTGIQVGSARGRAGREILPLPRQHPENPAGAMTEPALTQDRAVRFRAVFLRHPASPSLQLPGKVV